MQHCILKQAKLRLYFEVMFINQGFSDIPVDYLLAHLLGLNPLALSIPSFFSCVSYYPSLKKKLDYEIVGICGFLCFLLNSLLDLLTKMSFVRLFMRIVNLILCVCVCMTGGVIGYRPTWVSSPPWFFFGGFFFWFFLRQGFGYQICSVIG